MKGIKSKKQDAEIERVAKVVGLENQLDKYVYLQNEQEITDLKVMDCVKATIGVDVYVDKCVGKLY